MKLSYVIEAIRQANPARVPIYLWGAPGIGKTSIVEQAAELLGVQLVTMRANLLEPTDFLGLPKFSGEGANERVKWVAPDFMPDPEQRGIVFIDELAQARMDTQCAAMQLVDKIPDQWQVVAASNRSTDRAGAGQVATHVLSRFTHLDVDVSRGDWQNWALSAGIRPEVRAFIDFRPHLLFSFDAQEMQKNRANPSPRSWHRVSRLVESAGDLETNPALLDLLAGTVSAGPATEFYGFLKLWRDLPRPEDILADPNKSPIPKEPSTIFAICAALADYCRTTKDAIEKAGQYALRLPMDFATVLVVDLCAIGGRPALKLPSLAKWVQLNKGLLIGRDDK